MEALIDITSNANSNLQNNLNDSNKELVALLKHKIEESIIENGKIAIDVSTHLINCRNTIYAEEYEVESNYFHLNHGNFELHINLDKIEMKYDNSLDENFILTNNDTEINIHFLE